MIFMFTCPKNTAKIYQKLTKKNNKNKKSNLNINI